MAARYGETDASPYLLPVSVDGLIVVASICLVELAARIRHLEETALAAVAPSTVDIPTANAPARLAMVPTELPGHDDQVVDELVPETPTQPATRPQIRDRPAAHVPSRASSAPARRPGIATLGGPAR